MYTQKETQFYPTPKELAEHIGRKINQREICSVLEPSAGKGDLLLALDTKYSRAIEVIEADPNLQAILKEKDYPIVGDDFLNFSTYMSYDLILMNPPFKDGDKHLLKAIEIQKNGGQIICILNAETLKNPYSNTRKELLAKIEDYDGEVEYLTSAFSNAERKTDVEIAIVYLNIPKVVYNMDIFNNLIAGEEFNSTYEEYNKYQLATNNAISNILKQYNDESRLGLTLIDTYEKMAAIIPDYTFGGTKTPLIKMSISSSETEDEKKKCYSLKNSFIRQLRYKYWSLLFQSNELSKLFTQEVKQQYMTQLNKMRAYDFTPANIRKIYADLSKNLSSNIEQAILKQFDELSYQGSLEKANNIHYFNGWKTNSAFKINKKVIIRHTYNGDGWNFPYKGRDILEELEKIFTYLDAEKRDGEPIYPILSKAFGRWKYTGERLHFKYFDVEFKKKGTLHLWFNDLELLKKFNIFGANKKGWLPNDYGKKSYSEMNEEEKEVVNSFEGKKEYEDTMRNSSYYLGNTTQNLLGIGMNT